MLNSEHVSLNNESYLNPNLRHDIVFLYDATDCNPNGDPDNENLPRTDFETGQGLVSDVCLKRKIRQFVLNKMGQEDGYEIYVQSDQSLNSKHEEAHKKVDPENKYEKSKKDEKRKIEIAAQSAMCKKYFDVRTFGAVMSTGEKNCGQLRGPIQFTLSRSFDKVQSYDIGLTRQAITTDEDFKKMDSTMGRKASLYYGLYKGHAYFNPLLAKDELPYYKGTGFNEEDLKIFYEALEQMFWPIFDASASRGQMAMQGVGIFTHDCTLGRAAAHKLFEKIKAKSTKEFPRNKSDYNITWLEDGPVSDHEGVWFHSLVKP